MIRPRLLCFPFAGGGSAAFASWPARLSEVAEVVPARLPGRDERRFERMPAGIDALAELLAVELRAWCRPPYAIYGHSMGALLAYRFAHALACHRVAPPSLLIVAAHRAPHLPTPLPFAHSLPRAEFVGLLRGYGATPDAVLADEELLDFLLPAVRADFALSELAPRYGLDQPLDVPIIALGGRRDPLVGEADLAAWGAHTTSDFRAVLLPGGHLFQYDDEARVLDLIADELRGLQPTHERNS